MRSATAASFAVILIAGTIAGGPARGVGGATPDSTAARSLFDALEAKLLAARAVQLDGRFHAEGPLVMRCEGPIAVAADNRASVEQSGELGGKPISLRFSSNGGAVRVDAGEKSLTVGAAGKIADALLVPFTRMGFLHQIYVLSTAQVPQWTDGSARTHVTVSDFDLGKETSIEGKACSAVRFHISVDGSNSGRATLWLDRESGLPVRRTQEVYFGPDTMRVVEEYADVRLDAEVPAERFLVPNPR
jgi:hypothetical protein